MDPDGDYSAGDDESAQELTSSPAQEPSDADDGTSSADGPYLPGDSDSDADGLGEPPRGRSLKRPAEAPPGFRPFKRQRGTVNLAYLELLNQDIDDAAQRVCLDDDIDLPPAHIGLTCWSPLEKRQFFEALARVGRHQVPEIAARVGSKSAIEVQHYLDFLQHAREARRRFDRRSILEPAEYPAAAEYSQRCCRAQDEAADVVSLLQEQSEARREEAKWGPCWDVTPSIARALDRTQGAELGRPPPFAQLFYTARWLELSRRFFMNSSVPGSNWSDVDDVPPSMWATTFGDFYSLTVSVTRRLVQASLFISMSRIRAKRELVPKTRSFVRRKDVEAAVASLGMPPDAQHLWAGSARRLRLDVYDEPPGLGDEADAGPMPYDDVERALSAEELHADEAPRSPVQGLVFRHGSDDELDDTGDDADDGQDNVPALDEDAQGQREIDLEANELLWYSAVGLRDIAGARQALRLRVATERRQEEHAGRSDEHASYVAEMDMWAVLRKTPPADMPRVPDPGRPERSNLDVESIYPVRGDWASQAPRCSEWETW